MVKFFKFLPTKMAKKVYFWCILQI